MLVCVEVATQPLRFSPSEPNQREKKSPPAIAKARNYRRRQTLSVRIHLGSAEPVRHPVLTIN